jgi:CRISPR-associated protein Cas1
MIIKGEHQRRISPKRVTSIAITSHCVLHTQSLELAAKNEIPIILFNRIGKAYSRMWSPYFVNLAELRKQQWRFGESTESTKWIIDLFKIKTEQQVLNLKWLIKKAPQQKTALQIAIKKMTNIQKSMSKHENTLLIDCRSNLMGIEGSIARIYFQALSPCLPKSYQFERRSRRPALDHFNAALNYLYGMTYSIVEGALFAAGLDGQQGLLHADEYQKPTLSFDLIEPFRPWIDRLLMEQVFELAFAKNFFAKNKHGWFLSKHGKAYLIPFFNDFIQNHREFQFRNLSNKNQIYHLAGSLATKIRTFNAEIIEKK